MGVPIGKQADVILALKVLMLQVEQNMSWNEALLTVGITKNAKFVQKWREAFQIANNILMTTAAQNIPAVSRATVMSRWPEMLRRLVDISLLGEAREAIKAVELLYQIVPFGETNESEVPNAAKLFDPSEMLRRNINITQNNITITAAAPSPTPVDQALDAQLVEEESEHLPELYLPLPLHQTETSSE